MESELIFERGTPPNTVYTFKHALVQDAAHSSLLRSSRQQLHAQIAGALETHSPELMDTAPELFAQHYAEAGMIEKSVFYWGEAGRRSAARSAIAEAAAQFHKGLEQLAMLPDTPERQRQELELRSGLGAVSMVWKGFAAPETGQAYARAAYCGSSPVPSEFLQVPMGSLSITCPRQIRCGAARMRPVAASEPLAATILAGSLRGTSPGMNLMLRRPVRFSSRSHLEQVLAHRFDVPLLACPPSGLELIRMCLAQVFPGMFCSFSAFRTRHWRGEPRSHARLGRLAHPPSLALSLATGATLSSFADHATPGAVDRRAGCASREQGFLTGVPMEPSAGAGPRSIAAMWRRE